MVFEELIDAVEPIKHPGRGRPRRRPKKLHADKAYDDKKCKGALCRRGIKSRIARKGIERSKKLGRHRWVVEVSEEAQQAAEAGEVMMKDMPLEGTGMDPEAAHDDLAQRVTEDTGSRGDPHLHAERKVEQMGKEMLKDV